MESKILLCIFSYNRRLFLQNLMHSIDLFYNDLDVAIFDDNSSDKSLLDYYKTLDKKIKLFTFGSSKKNRHGNLYSMMNKALEYAAESKYEYVFFIQDDTQFLWRNDNLFTEIDTVFKRRENLLMYSPIFMQKIYKPQMKEVIALEGEDFFVSGRAIGDIGIIKITRAVKHHLKFSHKGEKYNGEKYSALGLKLMLAKNPIIAWVPWSDFYREKKKSFKFISYRTHKLFVKKLSDENIKKLKKNNAFAYLEDYTGMQSNLIPKPYVHAEKDFKSIVKLYIKYYLNFIK